MATPTKTGMLNIPMPKQNVVGALEYAISTMLMQYQLKYNIRITSVELETGADGTVQRIKLGWQETASGVRTTQEVQQIIQQEAASKLQSLTKILAENE